MGLVLVVGAGVPAVSAADPPVVYPAFGEQAVDPSPDLITHDCPDATASGEPVQMCLALADRLSAIRWRDGAIHDSIRAGLAGIGDQLDELNSTTGGLASTLDLLDEHVQSLGETSEQAAQAIAGMSSDQYPLLVEIRDALVTNGGLPESVSLASGDRTTIEDLQGSIHADVWFLAGLVAAAMVGFQLHRVLRP